MPPLQVAGRLGVRSLRGQTLAESSDYMHLGVHSVEAFGQSEALTTRLRHIISDYADGPGILMELLQNADDAGATEVAFLLDEESYPTSSILGASLEVSMHAFWIDYSLALSCTFAVVTVEGLNGEHAMGQGI